MIQIIPNERTNSVFVNSIFKFWREYDNHLETPAQFKEHCRLLENARQGYVWDELGEAAEKTVFEYDKRIYAHVCSKMEEMCSYIETYRAETLFGPWRYTKKNRIAPEFPAEKKSMQNLIFSLQDHVRPMRQSAASNDVSRAIEHLQQNFDYIISELNRLRAVDQNAAQPAGGFVHQQHLAQLKLLGSCSR